MRQANWHEVGGNAKVLKGTEEDALAEHAPPPLPGTKAGRGCAEGRQPSHVEALYPKGISRKRPGKGT
ncbi:MAG: hypothetical protein IT463_11325 [Planctomycetes bacterium]|nr:hypothetical protein [Planctomycetota bacterium]